MVNLLNGFLRKINHHRKLNIIFLNSFLFISLNRTIAFLSHGLYSTFIIYIRTQIDGNLLLRVGESQIEIKIFLFVRFLLLKFLILFFKLCDGEF